jgi:hypothetical protein
MRGWKGEPLKPALRSLASQLFAERCNMAPRMMFRRPEIAPCRLPRRNAACPALFPNLVWPSARPGLVGIRPGLPNVLNTLEGSQLAAPRCDFRHVSARVRHGSRYCERFNALTEPAPGMTAIHFTGTWRLANLS